MFKQFKHKRILITGGASGLGKALAQQFAKLGWNIAIVDINMDGANKVAEQLSKRFQNNGTNVITFYANLGEDSDFEQIAKEIGKRWSGLDILINNAGVGSPGGIEKISLQEWHRVINLNLNSVFRGCQAWLPLLKESGCGHIVNTSSAAAFMQIKDMICYNVSKAAVLSLSECLRKELAEHNIGVSVLCPYYFKSSLTDSMVEASEQTKINLKKAMERALLTADDIAKLTLQGIERNDFMIIPSRKLRWLYFKKRLFPKRYMP